jgi:hypothetical protein
MAANNAPEHPLQWLRDKLNAFKAGDKASELQLYEKEMLRAYDPKDYDLTSLYAYVSLDADGDELQEEERRIVYIIKSLKKKSYDDINEINHITQFSMGKTPLRMLIEDGRRGFKQRIPLIRWLCEKGGIVNLEEDETIDSLTDEPEVLEILKTCPKAGGKRRSRRSRRSRTVKRKKTRRTRRTRHF